MSDVAEAFPQEDSLKQAQEIARLAADHASAVDALARFPAEAISAARQAGLLSAGIKPGGQPGCDLRLQAAICFILAQSCASSAMVLAMHYIQVDGLATFCHGNDRLNRYLEQLAREQRLIASATSEVSVDGDLRRSIAAIEQDGERFTLSKQATTVSYGQHADDYLITARANPEAAEADQRLVLALGNESDLATAGSWDTLGMRGTVSPGGTLTTSGQSWQILETPFAEIAAVSMVPVSHLLWSACWLGIARSALDRARAAVQKKGRKNPEEARPAAERLAAIYARYEQLRTQQQTDLDHYSALLNGGDRRALTALKETIRFNNLKIDVSEGVAQIVQQAIQAAGIAAYRNDSEYSLGRHLRDALSASLMINNDRIRTANADMQLVLKDR